MKDFALFVLVGLFLLPLPCRADGLGPGMKRHGIPLGMLRIDHPATFLRDDRSDLELEMAHGTRFKAPDSDLTLEVIPYGWVPHDKGGFRTVEGYLNARFRSQDTVRDRFTGYDRLVKTSASEVRVFFFSGQIGNNLQSLRFKFEEGGYQRHKTVIDRVIASARPKFSHQRRAEMAEDLKLLGTSAAD